MSRRIAGLTCSPFRRPPKKASMYVSCNVAYPMYGVPLMVVLEMDTMESHEALLACGVLVEHHPGDAKPVIFVSHQWVSEAHPDPDFTQFAILQGAFRRLLSGQEVRSDWLHSLIAFKDKVVRNWPAILQDALVWYDYFSVPQAASNRESTQLAIESISTYIEMASVIFVLAPTVDHHDFVDANREALLCDYYSWQQRGWCRLEVFAAHLKVNSQPLVVIRSESYIHFVGTGRQAALARVAEGEFMCCTLNHQRTHSDGTASLIPCDKPPIFDVISALITNRVLYERKKGNLRMVRLLLACRHVWLRDLLPAEESYNALEVTLDAFLVSYGFASPHEFDGGWTPLRFACISGNVNVARQLIEQKADVEANFKSSCAYTESEKGMNILSSVIALCCCVEHEEILDLLVKHNAKLRTSRHPDALTYASTSMSPLKQGARWLLRTFPRWDVNKKSYGLDGMPRWPLYCSVGTNADIDYLRHLCAHKADLTLRDWPLALDVFHVSCAMCPSSSPDIPKRILQELQKCSTDNDALRATSIAIQPVPDYVNESLAVRRASQMMLKLGRASGMGPTALMDLLLLLMGSTPLISAASEGKHRVCKWLIEQKADTSITNTNEETALSIAQKRGFTRVVDVLRGTSSSARV